MWFSFPFSQSASCRIKIFAAFCNLQNSLKSLPTNGSKVNAEQNVGKTVSLFHTAIDLFWFRFTFFFIAMNISFVPKPKRNTQTIWVQSMRNVGREKLRKTTQAECVKSCSNVFFLYFFPIFFYSLFYFLIIVFYLRFFRVSSKNDVKVLWIERRKVIVWIQYNQILKSFFLFDISYFW